MRSRWLAPAVTAAMWIFLLAVYSRLPQYLPTHWDAYGEADGWTGKPLGALMLPLMATATLVLIRLVRRVDPRSDNIDRFDGEWLLVNNLIVLFFALLEVATFGHALGWPLDEGRVVLVGVGLLFVGLGNYLPRIRSNWFMGIRTPWTMDNERVWRATHRVGGRTFVAAGIIMMLSAFLPPSARAVATVGAVALAAGVPLVYSYIAYRRDLTGRPL
ncbi:MAG TPA: SdpI family protein [Longimicrobium sp.]|nr:SdpI family protein [Longimicrobium sp.]